MAMLTIVAYVVSFATPLLVLSWVSCRFYKHLFITSTSDVSYFKKYLKYNFFWKNKGCIRALLESFFQKKFV